jgi:hypothetical protein
MNESKKVITSVVLAGVRNFWSHQVSRFVGNILECLSSKVLYSILGYDQYSWRDDARPVKAGELASLCSFDAFSIIFQFLSNEY